MPIEDKSYGHILDIVDIQNMVSEIDNDHLDEIGASVCSEYDIDKKSMDDWFDKNKLALKLIDMKPSAVTNPWPGAAGTKLPLVLNAAMKASAEEFAEIMRGNNLVKSEIFGKITPEKEQRVERVTKRMNHQFYHELEDWEEDHDKLIMSKNILGTVHKKIFWADGKIQCVLRRTGVVINDNVEKIQDAPRITDEIDKFWWQYEEKVNAGEWEEIDLTSATNTDFAESDKLNLFLEQVRRIDLDGDGYPEPYIVTVHKETKKIVRIEPNFTPESITFDEEFDIEEYEDLEDEEKGVIKGNVSVVRVDGNIARLRYVKYSMIPNWEGGYWDYGFGILLGPLNDNCNELINILLNQGHLQAKGGGFINAGIKMGSGELRFKNNEWKKIQSPGMDLSRNIVPLPIKEPSQTLFSLLGLLMDTLRELSSVTEVMSGTQPKANMPASSIDMLIEQGKKMFNSVYKRHWRALTKEQNAVFDLNFLYQDPQQYADLLDLEASPEELMPMIRADFTREGIDIKPTANAEFSSNVQRMAKARALGDVAGRNPGIVNQTMIARMEVEAIVDDSELADEFVPEEPNMTPEQVSEQMEQKKQEMLDDLEVKKAQAETEAAQSAAQTASIGLEIKKIEAQGAGPKTQSDIQTKQLGIQKADIALEKERLSVDKERLSVEKERLAVAKEAIAVEKERLGGNNEGVGR